MVLEHCDPLDQPPDHSFIVVRHRLLTLVQKGFELVQPLLHGRAVGVLQKKGLLFFPERINLVGQFLKPLLGVCLLQELLLQLL